jgi:hypothetical protein
VKVVHYINPEPSEAMTVRPFRLWLLPDYGVVADAAGLAVTMGGGIG